MNVIKGKEETVTLTIPIAVLRNEYGIPAVLRMIHCTVTCTQLKVNSTMPIKNNVLLPFQLDSIKISEIIQVKTQEVSLLYNIEENTALLDALFKERETYNTRAYLYGVQEITYIDADGTVEQGNVYYALISHYKDEEATSRAIMHGYWDYRGVWHMGIAELQEDATYITETRVLHEVFGYEDVCERMPQWKKTLTKGTCLTVIPFDTTCSCKTELRPTRKATTMQSRAMIASRQLTMTSSVVDAGITGLCCDIGEEITALPPVVTLPPFVIDVSVYLYSRAGITYTDVDAAYTGKWIKQLASAALHTICFSLPKYVKHVHVRVAGGVCITGVEKCELASYCVSSIQFPYNYVLPRRLAGALTLKYVMFSLQVNGYVPYIADVFNLYAISTDLSMAFIDVAGQPWNNVILPTVVGIDERGPGVVYKSAVEREALNLTVLPGKLLAVEPKRDSIRATVNLQFVDKDIVPYKVVNLDFGQMKSWSSIWLDFGCSTNDYRDYDGTRNTVNIRVGIPYVQKTKEDKCALLHCSTSCMTTENIVAPAGIPNLQCKIKAVQSRGTNNMSHAGTMHVSGNVNTLVIHLTQFESVPIKHIYIDGVVKSICCFVASSADDALIKGSLLNVRVHLRRAIQSSVRFCLYSFDEGKSDALHHMRGATAKKSVVVFED